MIVYTMFNLTVSYQKLTFSRYITQYRAETNIAIYEIVTFYFVTLNSHRKSYPIILVKKKNKQQSTSILPISPKTISHLEVQVQVHSIPHVQHLKYC